MEQVNEPPWYQKRLFWRERPEVPIAQLTNTEDRLKSGSSALNLTHLLAVLFHSKLIQVMVPALSLLVLCKAHCKKYPLCFLLIPPATGISFEEVRGHHAPPDTGFSAGT